MAAALRDQGRASALAALVLLFCGCDDGLPPGGGPGPGPGPDGTCATPDTGCACDLGEGPATCYLDPEPLGGGRMMCHVGTRYCRSGTWSECEGLTAFELDLGSTAALITPPSECNPCNPDCFGGSDYPDDTDLNPGNSGGVEYNTALGGVVLTACGIPPAPLVRYQFDGGDTNASITDRAPAAPTLNVQVGSGTVTVGATAFGGAATFGTGLLRSTAFGTGDANSTTLRDVIRTAGELTAEVWVTSPNGTQTGPKRIMTLSNGTTLRAFTIAQEGADAIVRLRTTATDMNGTTYELTAPGIFPAATPVHIVTTWDNATGIHSLYVNGVLVDTANHGAATLANWTDTQHFGMGDEFGGGRDWTGTIYQAAVYGMALDASDVTCRFNAGADPMDSFDDSDGDEVPDAADECVGVGFRLPCDGSATNDGLFHTLPFGGPPEVDPLTVDAQITTADIYVLMDASGSMQGEIDNLRTALTSGTIDGSCPDGVNGGVLGAIRCTISGAWYGVGFFREFPVAPHGDANSVPYRHLQDITSDLTAAQAAVNTLLTDSNSDTPESQTPSLYSVATGDGLGQWVPDRAACAGTGWGYPCFRDNTIPIILLITDAAFHNGTTVANDYSAALDSAGFAMPNAFPVSNNDTVAGAYDLGNLTAGAVNVIGSTVPLGDHLDGACVTNSTTGFDAIFHFTLTSTQTVYFGSRMSDFNTVVSLWNNAGTIEAGCNNNWSGAHPFGWTEPYTLTSRFSQSLAAGTYTVALDSRSDSAGSVDYRGSYQLLVGTSSAGGTTAALPITWAQMTGALSAQQIKVLSIVSSTDSTAAGADPEARQDAEQLGIATDSVDDVGTPYVYYMSDTGAGLSSAIVTAVQDLANFTLFDLSLVAEDNAATAAVDETGFVDSVTPTSCPAACTPGISGSMCLGCPPGTNVQFAVTFRNDIVPAAPAPQVFEFDMVLYANGVFELDRVPVRIVVPPSIPFFPAAGYYIQEYDTTTYCNVPVTRPNWGDFTWTVDTASDSTIGFQFRTADTQVGLSTASAVGFTVPTTVPVGAPPLDIGDFLVANGESNHLPFLRITAILNASSDAVTSPVLYGFEQEFLCEPVE